jgi:hypothetical protein
MNMHLSSVFPAEPLRAKFSQSVLIEHWDKSQLAKIATLKKVSIFEIGAGAWDRYVASNQDCDPQALSKYFQEQDSKLYLAMERQIRSKVLIDISYTFATIEDDAPLSRCVSELLLAIVHPGVLCISDVTFANVYAPMPDNERRYPFQSFKGLGLLPILIDNCSAFCRAHGISQITLTAADAGLMNLFQSYGFKVADTPAGRLGLRTHTGIPMTRKVERLA